MRQNRTQYEADVREEQKRAKREGISNTPGFVLYHPASDHSTTFFGAQPYSTFQQRIHALHNQQ